MDGGILINFAIETFDDPRRGANRRTLALGFELPKASPKLRELSIIGIVFAYLNFQESLDATKAHNISRMILLPTKDVGTIPRPLTEQKKWK